MYSTLDRRSWTGRQPRSRSASDTSATCQSTSDDRDDPADASLISPAKPSRSAIAHIYDWGIQAIRNAGSDYCRGYVSHVDEIAYCSERPHLDPRCEAADGIGEALQRCARHRFCRHSRSERVEDAQHDGILAGRRRSCH
jgi:hypothetical protein